MITSILTVTTQATSRDLTVLDTVKSELDITDASQNEKLARMITQASGMLAERCNRVFAQETVSEQFRLTVSSETLKLTRYPVSVIASIVENGTALVAADYELDGPSGILKRLSSDTPTCWPSGKITVAYTAGYLLLDNVPHSLERACIVLVKSMFHAAARDPLVKGESVPGVQDTQYWVGAVGDAGLPPEVEEAISYFREPSV